MKFTNYFVFEVYGENKFTVKVEDESEIFQILSPLKSISLNFENMKIPENL